MKLFQKPNEAWASVSLSESLAFGSIQIDLIYYGLQNSGVSDNPHHMSSALLLKINSPEGGKCFQATVCNLLVSFIYYQGSQKHLSKK